MEQIETIGATEQRELTRIRISVRNLVEFIFRSGDIDNRIGKGAQKVFESIILFASIACALTVRCEYIWLI